MLAQLTGSKLAPSTEELQRNWKSKRNILRDSADAEDGANGDGACEHEQAEERADGDDEPDGVDGRLGVAIDFFPPAAAGERAITGVSVDDARGGDGTAVKLVRIGFLAFEKGEIGDWVCPRGGDDVGKGSTDPCPI